METISVGDASEDGAAEEEAAEDGAAEEGAAEEALVEEAEGDMTEATEVAFVRGRPFQLVIWA